METFNAEMLGVYTQACGWALARAHAKASEISATISGCLGGSNDAFDAAMGKFALAYADQAELDHAVLKPAIRKGKVIVAGNLVFLGQQRFSSDPARQFGSFARAIPVFDADHAWWLWSK